MSVPADMVNSTPFFTQATVRPCLNFDRRIMLGSIRQMCSGGQGMQCGCNAMFPVSACTSVLMGHPTSTPPHCPLPQNLTSQHDWMA
eukprot:1159208-Pelagomonas_calceolata.AAC.15